MTAVEVDREGPCNVEEQNDFLSGYLRAHGADFGHDPEAVLSKWREQGGELPLGQFLVREKIVSRFGLAKLSALQRGLLGTDDPGKILLGRSPAEKPGPALDARETARMQRAGGERTERLPDLAELQRDLASAASTTVGHIASTPVERPAAIAPPPSVGASLGWLLCPPFPPVPLLPGKVITFGRADTCDFPLPHPAVSRQHAVLKVRKGMMLEDEGSSNGTFLNGKRVSSHLVRDGDLIAIGPFEIEITCDAGAALGGGTRKFRLPVEGAVGGSLKEMPLPELLQSIEFNQKTGSLVIYSEQEVGLLGVDSGTPLYAEFGELRGSPAVLRMLRLVEGEFSFSSALEERPREMQVPLTALLLEASRQQDEGP